MDPLNAEFVRLLASAGWSQATAAEKLKVSEAAISGYVNSNIRPSVRIIKAFKLLIGDRLPMPEHGIDAAELNDHAGQLTEDERALLDILHLLDVPTRRAVITHFQAIASLIAPRPVQYVRIPSKQRPPGKKLS